MQSAIASLRTAGPTKVVKHDERSFFCGIGTEDLALSGHYDFQVVHGAVALCGNTLTCSSTFHHVSAPVAPFPYFRPVHSRESKSDHQIEALKDYSTVLFIKAADNPADLSIIAPPYKSLWHPLFRIDNLKNANLYDIPKSWSSIDSSAQRVAILGPKNSGKSSLGRFLTNRAVLLNSRVLYLELDPGQPEFSPPGCLTLHELNDSELNFSPPYVHASFPNAIKAHHLGYSSPVDAPHRYLAMCEDLFDTYLQMAKPTDVLIVNTPGWTKGLGLELNSTIARMVQPATLVHMGPSDFVLGDLEVQVVTKIDQLSDESTATTITASGFSSAELRALQLLCYFHEHTTEPLTKWAPYELPLGVDKAGILGFAVMDSAGIDLREDLAVCVEGTLVSINVVHADVNLPAVALAEDDADNLWQISTCIGLAVVQSLSLENGVVRLLTPVDPVALDLGNKRIVLCRGRIQLPIWGIHNRSLEPPVPWISTVKPQGVGGSYTKFRRNLLR